MCLEKKNVLDTICCLGVTSAPSLSTVQHSIAALLAIGKEALLFSSCRGLTAPGLDNNITTATGSMQVVYHFDDSALYFQDVLKAFQMYPHFSAFPYVPS